MLRHFTGQTSTHRLHRQHFRLSISHSFLSLLTARALVGQFLSHSRQKMHLSISFSTLPALRPYTFFSSEGTSLWQVYLPGFLLVSLTALEIVSCPCVHLPFSAADARIDCQDNDRHICNLGPLEHPDHTREVREGRDPHPDRSKNFVPFPLRNR